MTINSLKWEMRLKPSDRNSAWSAVSFDASASAEAW